MAGLADLLYLGAPDPARQLAQMLAGSQPQQPGGQGAGPGDGPPTPNGPAPPADPTNPSGAPNPAPGAPPPPGSPPQPTALTSTPDMSQSYSKLANPPSLMSLYLQMDARDRAEDQMNRGFALIAANHSSPAMARAIMESIPGQANAGQTASTLMSLYGAQQQMGAQQSMLANADVYDQKLNLPPGTSRSMILAGRGDELVRSLEPTPEVRDIQAKHDMFIKNAVSQGQDPQAAEQTWQRDYMPYLLTGGAGGGDSATRSWQTERINWNRDNPGQPYPWGTDDPQSFALWKAKQNKLDDDQTDALQKRQPYVQNLTDLRNSLGDIVGLKPGESIQFNKDGSINPSNLDPAKYKLLNDALSAPGAQAYLSGDPSAWATQNVSGVALTQEQKQVLDAIRSATNPKAIFGSVTGRAPRRSQSDVTAIGSNLEDMRNLRRSPADWLGSVAKTVTAADTAVGNAYGASGEAENAPDYSKPLIDDSYLSGGSMYPFGKKPTPMTPDQIAQGQAHIKANPGDKTKIIKVLRANNFDPTPLM